MKPKTPMKEALPPLRRPGWALAFGAALLLGVHRPASAAQQETGDPSQASSAVETALEGMDSWVELRAQISKERSRHAERVAFLKDRIELIRGQVEDTKKLTAERLAEIEKSTTRREELEAEDAALKGASESLVAVIDPLEARTKALLVRMPDPLQEGLQTLSQNLPKDPATTELSLSKRFGQVVGLLNLIDKFGTDIHLSTETRDIGSGTAAQVTALYLGISTGYYVNATGDRAGRGYVTDTGFEWAPANDDAAEIQRAVGVLNGELPEFIQVPAVLD